jgi:DNA-binding Lrp family transcriptional regulator
MTELGSTDLRLLWALIKDSRRSDRQLAKDLGISQPTVTRRRTKLEKNFIEGYTATPKWDKIGFEMIAFTFVKSRVKYGKSEENQKALQRTKELYARNPNVIFALSGQGMGWDGVCISFHKSYSDFMAFIRKHDMELSDLIIESQTFLADLNPGIVIKPFHFKYLVNAK